MKTILLILSTCFALVASVHSQENRIWTYTKTGSTCEGTLQWKSPDGTELQIKRKDNGRVITVKAEMLIEEDQKQINAWQVPAPAAPEATIGNAGPAPSPPDGSNRAAIQKKLDSLIIPKIDLDGATLYEVIEFIRLRCAELDVAEVVQSKKGIFIGIEVSQDFKHPRLNLRLQNIPVGTLLKYIADKAGMRLKIDEYSVELRPAEWPDTPEPKAILSDSAAAVAIQKKLGTIFIPRIDFQDTSLEEAIDFIRLRCGELDEAEIDKSKKGINFVLTRSPSSNSPRVNLRLQNVPVGWALNCIADQVGMKVRIKEYFVELMPREWPDTPELNATLSEVAGAAAKIIIPRTDFEDTTLEQAVTYYNARIKELAQGKNAPEIILDATADKGARLREFRVRNVSLLALISYIASCTNHRVISKGNTLRITKK